MRCRASAPAGPGTARRWPTGLLVALCGAWIAAGSADAQHVSAAGESFAFVLTVPSADGVAPALRVRPAPGVSIHAIPRAPLSDDSGEVVLVAVVAQVLAPGVHPVGTAFFEYPDGRQLAIELFARVVAPVPSVRPVDPLPPALPQVHDASPAFQTSARPVSVAVPATSPAPSAPARRGRLTGGAYVGATELDTHGSNDADVGMGIDLSGRINGSTQVSALYIRGWNPGVSPVFRYGMHRSRGHLRIRAPGYTLEAGELRPETPLAGVRVPADGVSFQDSGGPVVGSFAAARPKYFGGGWGGHLVQGTVGLAFPNGSISLFASQLARPVLPSRIAASPLPEEDSELIVEDLERLGPLLSRENRARTGGIETRLRFGGHHIVARGGWLELLNSSNDRIDGPAATGSYSFTGERASFYGQFRSMPGSVPGVSLTGDLATAGGKFELVPSLAFIGRTYWNETSLPGRNRPTRGRGAAAGLEYSSGQARVHVTGNYRESHFLSTGITRSVTAGVRLPITAAAGLDAAAEYGTAADGRSRRRIATYRGSLYTEGERAALMLSGSYRDYGISSPRLSIDLSGTVWWRKATFEGGAGISRSGIFGDVANAWTTVEFPVPGDLTVLLGVDYDRWSFERSPYLIFFEEDDFGRPWRFTFTIRRKLSFPMPFAK